MYEVKKYYPVNDKRGQGPVLGQKDTTRDKPQPCRQGVHSQLLTPPEVPPTLGPGAMK